jgi:amidase/6-aminohexanoate-cyclic-dimer hydrolase
MHWAPGNLPVGLHFAAAYGEDETLMGLAADLEEAAPWQAKQLELIRQLH